MRRSANRFLRHSEFKMTTMRQRAAMLTLGFSMMLVTVAAAQQSPPAISVKSGIIQHLQHKIFSGDSHQYAVYTEAQIERRLATIYNGLIVTSGALYVGYWDDGISKTTKIPCYDCTIYSYRSYTVGMRFYANPYAFPLDLFTGLSYHFAHANFVKGLDLPGRRVEFWNGLGTMETGIRLVIPVADHLAVNVEFQAYMHLSNHKRLGTRKSVKLGVSYPL